MNFRPEDHREHLFYKSDSFIIFKHERLFGQNDQHFFDFTFLLDILLLTPSSLLANKSFY